ncbi:MAG: hypothetical protein DWQ07_22070 [Chloroflexi bacterium]|nr:MAG: hypothetical protein DWQ07_22070 [Chloroflexota bacterium]MBL1196358.1 hypothetical protein [Chloroflexota bacterium]NOH13653.1 hypothetical protein [Chloroflexota bacterium]
MSQDINPEELPPGDLADAQNDSVLGFSIRELAGISVDELTGNETAIKMVMHYYRQLIDDNNVLNNEINTLKTYVDAYETKKTKTAVGAILLGLSNILTGFGINLLTNNQTWPGLATLIPGVCLIIGGLYLTYRD